MICRLTLFIIILLVQVMIFIMILLFKNVINFEDEVYKQSWQTKGGWRILYQKFDFYSILWETTPHAFLTKGIFNVSKFPYPILDQLVTSTFFSSILYILAHQYGPLNEVGVGITSPPSLN